MSAEIFSGAMKGEVDAKVQGTLIEWGGEGIVDQRGDLAVAGDVRDRTQVGKSHNGIAGSLYQDKLCVGAKRALESRRIALIYLGNFHAKPGQQVLEQIQRTAIVIGL